MSLPKILAIIAGGMLAVSITFSEFTHAHTAHSDPPAIAARYTLPDDLEAATNALDWRTGLPVEVKVKATGHRMCLIRPGTFEMGSGFEDEAPVHTVFVSAAYLSKQAVCNTEIEKWKPSHRAHRGAYSRRDASPATRVDWNGADAYCDWVSSESGVPKGSYRLPTEAEAEAAARGGLPQCRYPWGDDMDPAVKAMHSPDVACDADAGCENPWGFRQMTSGVFFWLNDFYGEDYYNPKVPGNQINPTGPWKDTGHRGLRGGSWYVYNMSFRCADRWKALPSTSEDHVGLRILRTLPAPADLPMWTGRPPRATKSSGGVARLAAANAGSGTFCIEEAFRAVRALAEAVGYGLPPWPNNTADGEPGDYPPDGFYCEDLANDPSGNVGSNLVMALSSALADEGFLGKFVEEGNDTLLTLSTNELEVVDGADGIRINGTNYVSKFQMAVGYLPRLKATIIPGSYSGRLGFRSIRLVQTSCANAKAAANAGWSPNTNSWTPGGLVGVSAVVIVHRVPMPPPFPPVDQWDGILDGGGGYVSANLTVYPTGSAPNVYLSASVFGNGLGPNPLPSPLTDDGKMHLWDTAVGGTNWVSTKFLVGQKPEFDSDCPVPPPLSGVASLAWGWGAFPSLVVPVVPSTNYNASCAGCTGGPKIYFTQPSNGTNLTTCVGITNILECVVSNGMSVVTDGEVKFEVNPTLGTFTNTAPVKLDGEGKAKTAFVPSTLGQGEIKATGQNLKDPADHTTALPDTTTNIALNILDLKIRVDGNRDGAIQFADPADQTAEKTPFRFWINDDRDVPNAADVLSDEDPADGQDYRHTTITNIRDLEDFLRVQVQVGSGFNPADPTLSVKVQFVDVVKGTPSINFWQASKPGTEYLADETEATALVGESALGVVSTGAEVTIPNSLFDNPDKVAALLFDGRDVGHAALRVRIYHGSQMICEDKLHLELTTIRDMYEHYTVGDTATMNVADIPVKAKMAKDSGKYNPQSTEDNKYILFVHGWRLRPWERRAFAETAFKRMWHQGYKGRFGLFSWPTEWHDGSTVSHLADPQHFDRSERKAWNSAFALRGVLHDLDRQYPGEVRVFAHSMGNTVVSEALRLEAFSKKPSRLVHTYIATQAAVVAHAFDSSARDILTGDLAFDDSTPNFYAHYPLAPGREYFRNIGSTAGAFVNYCNPVDYALHSGPHGLGFVWELNQATKPDEGYFYRFDGEIDRFFRPIIRPFGSHLAELTFPNDRYELFSHVIEGRSMALGAETGGGGVFIGSQVNLNTDLDPSPTPAPGVNFGRGEYEHSAQFNYHIQLRAVYWRAMLTNLGVPPPPL